MTTPLAVITATRGRPSELLVQARALGPQLMRGDRWVVVEDHQSDATRIHSQVLAGAWQSEAALEFIRMEGRAKSSLGPNAAKRTGIAASTGDAIIELDDHDFILPDAIQQVRGAFIAGYELIYGWCTGPHGVEPMRPYSAWGIRDFPKGNPCLGLRAYTRRLYQSVGGWPDVFPAGDYYMVMAMEQFFDGNTAKILCIQSPLVARGETRDSIQHRYAALRRRRLDAE